MTKGLVLICSGVRYPEGSTCRSQMGEFKLKSLKFIIWTPFLPSLMLMQDCANLPFEPQTSLATVQLDLLINSMNAAVVSFCFCRDIKHQRYSSSTPTRRPQYQILEEEGIPLIAPARRTTISTAEADILCLSPSPVPFIVGSPFSSEFDL